MTSATLNSLFLEAVERFGGATALRAPRADLTWSRISYDEVFRNARMAASALRALGVGRGEAAAILSANRPEWAFADYACLCAGVRDVPIYPSLTAPQIAYILRDSGARAVFAEDEVQLAKLMEIRDQCPELRHIIVFDPPGELPDGTMAWRDFVRLDPAGLEEGAGVGKRQHHVDVLLDQEDGCAAGLGNRPQGFGDVGDDRRLQAL